MDTTTVAILNTLSAPVIMVFSLIILGILIALGNERQRRALDEIRKEIEEWSANDLRLKRGTMSHSTDVKDPIAWLSAATSKALGTPVELAGMQIHDVPKSVQFEDGNSGMRMVYSLVEPGRMKRAMTRRLTKSDRINISSHPLRKWSRNIEALQLGILNAGLVFDLELPNAWKQMTTEASDSQVLWLYKF